MEHITQSEEWAKFRLATPNVQKVLRIGSSRIFIHHLPYIPNSIAYLPRPANLDNLEEIKIACRKENAIFLRVEPISSAKWADQISNSRPGRPILPQHTIYIDLTKPEEQLLQEMREKTRYNIRLAQKKGVVVKQSENIEEFISLLQKTETRQGFYSHYPNYYRKLWEILHPHLLTAYVNDKPAASIMLFVHDGALYYPYGGSDPKYKEFMSSHLLHWEAIRLGKKLGCKIYDMWGSYKERKDESDPWWGIYRFKSGFGGTEVDFPPTVDIPLSPLYPLFSLFDSFRWFLLKLPRKLKILR